MKPSNPRPPGPHPASRTPRPAPARGTVEIPKGWLALLAGGLIVALLVVAYLVGRESGRRASEAARLDPPAAAPELAIGHESPPAPLPPGEVYADPVQPVAPAALEENLPDAGRHPLGGIDPAAPPAAADSQAAAVAAYFTEIEGYERQAKYWSNPQELAMTLMGQGVQGDTRGFEQLLETQRTAQRQIEAMTVPFPCHEHHRRTLEVMHEALALLEQLEGGVASGNLEGLLGLSGEARQLEAETREVDALAAELKRQYGV
jgi:hypothetical protein